MLFVFARGDSPVKRQWSLRANDPFRACIRWTGGDTEDVEIVDDH